GMNSAWPQQQARPEIGRHTMLFRAVPSQNWYGRTATVCGDIATLRPNPRLESRSKSSPWTSLIAFLHSPFLYRSFLAQALPWTHPSPCVLRLLCFAYCALRVSVSRTTFLFEPFRKGA